MKKEIREKIYNKYQGRCAYCEEEITYEQMQVDHVIPKYHTWTDGEIENYNHKVQSLIDAKIKTKSKIIIRGTDAFENLMPSCRECNYPKATLSIEKFRGIVANKVKTINNNSAYKMAKKYGLIIETKAPVVFYFEKVSYEKL